MEGGGGNEQRLDSCGLGDELATESNQVAFETPANIPGDKGLHHAMHFTLFQIYLVRHDGAPKFKPKASSDDSSNILLPSPFIPGIRLDQDLVILLKTKKLRTQTFLPDCRKSGDQRKDCISGRDTLHVLPLSQQLAWMMRL
jgi:hypothetical protein